MLCMMAARSSISKKKMMGLGPVISQDVSINESVADLSALDLVVV